MSLLSSSSTTVAQAQYVTTNNMLYKSLNAVSNVYSVYTQYDAAIQGGAVGNYKVYYNYPIPAGAIIIAFVLDVTQVFQGGSGTILAIRFSDSSPAYGGPVDNLPWNIAQPTYLQDTVKLEQGSEYATMEVQLGFVPEGRVLIGVQYIL